MSGAFHTPDLSRRAFARTNRPTVEQRVALLSELFPQGVRAVGELCCGDCGRQQEDAWEIGWAGAGKAEGAPG